MGEKILRTPPHFWKLFYLFSLKNFPVLRDGDDSFGLLKIIQNIRPVEMIRDFFVS